MIETKLYKN